MKPRRAAGICVGLLLALVCAGLPRDAAAQTLASPEGLSGTALGVSSIGWTWGAVGGATSYNFYPSSGGVPISLAAPGYTQTVLSTNTAYGAWVSAVGTGGEGSLSSAVTAFTLAAAPTDFSVLFVASTSLQVGWEANGNPAGTVFAVEISTSPNLSYASTGTTQGLTETFSGLMPHGNYHLGVLAENGDGIPSAVVSLSTQLPSGPQPPPFPTGVEGTALGISSIEWTWNAVGGATGYNFYPSTGGPPISLTAMEYTQVGLSSGTTYGASVSATNSVGESPESGEAEATTLGAPPPLSSPVGLNGVALGVSSIAWTWAAISSATGYNFYTQLSPPVSVSSPTFVLTGAATNTFYAASVTAFFGPEGEGPHSSSASAVTFAAPPTSLAISQVQPSGVTLTWSADGNPGYTNYDVEAWVPGGSTVTQTASGTSLLFTGLAGTTLYDFQVVALNLASVASQPTLAVSTITAAPLPTGPPAPEGLTGTSLGCSSSTWSWDASPGATSYDFLVSTGQPVNVAETTSVTVGVQYSTTCAFNKPLYYAVAAVNANGVGPASATNRLFSLAAPPTGSTVTAVGISSTVIQWSDSLNSSFALTYRIDYFEAGGAISSVTGIPVSNLSSTIGGLSPATTYFFLVRAVNGNQVASSADIQQTAVTLPNPQIIASISATQATTVAYNPPSGPVLVTIPAGAFIAPVNMTLTSQSTFPVTNASPGGTVTGTGVGLQINLDQAVQPQQPVLLSLSYAGANLAGYNSADFVIARFDPAGGVWVPLPSTSSPGQHLVTAYTNHFSLFQIMAATPATNLRAPKVFPNPFRPALGHTVITFSNLPAFTTLKIYDILGERVRILSADAAGLASWDSKNSNGSNVASGVYFVLAGSGSSRTTFKVAIQR